MKLRSRYAEFSEETIHSQVRIAAWTTFPVRAVEWRTKRGSVCP